MSAQSPKPMAAQIPASASVSEHAEMKFHRAAIGKAEGLSRRNAALRLYNKHAKPSHTEVQEVL